MPVQSVAIVGAGIAGLALALALARRGIRTEILEQTEALREVGAGLQLSPNATRVLADLGVLDGLRRRWTEPVSIDLSSGITLGKRISIPLGKEAVARWGAPYAVVHRATLQTALLEAVTASPLCRLQLGQQIGARTIDDIASRCEQPPDLIAGADGVWSQVRRLVPRAPTSRFTGNVAWRIVVPFAEAPAELPRDRVCAFMGPGAHLVCYPLSDAGGFNLVAITGGFDPGETWEGRAEKGRTIALRNHFGKWHPVLRELIGRGDDLLYWPLCQASDGEWHDGSRVVLLGDSAHAMMPFMAQGAAAALEDAFVLAEAIATLPLPRALAAFEARRKPRARQLRERAEFNRRIYHATGPLRLGRDLALAVRPTGAFTRDLDWIYGYRAAL